MAGKKRSRRGRPPTGRAQTAVERMQRYRARRRAAGLRPTLRWQLAAPVVVSPGTIKHRIIEARSLAMHCLIAQKIAANPALLDIPRRNIAAWRSRYGSDPPRALDEWNRILKRSWQDIACILTDPGESATRLRQSSPFPGILTPAERKRVYEAFRS